MRVQALAVVLAVTFVAGCTAPPPPDPYARAPDGSVKDTITIPVQQVASLPPFGGRVPVHVVATIDVLTGGPIDAWLSNGTDCEKYGTRGFSPAARALNVTKASLVADLPAGDDCFILDNTDYALGRANATQNVTVHYNISLWERGT